MPFCRIERLENAISAKSERSIVHWVCYPYQALIKANLETGFEVSSAALRYVIIGVATYS